VTIQNLLRYLYMTFKRSLRLLSVSVLSFIFSFRLKSGFPNRARLEQERGIQVVKLYFFFMLYCLSQVFVEPGQAVEEGETLIVMEAMKMEV